MKLARRPRTANFNRSNRASRPARCELAGSLACLRSEFFEVNVHALSVARMVPCSQVVLNARKIPTGEELRVESGRPRRGARLNIREGLHPSPAHHGESTPGLAAEASPASGSRSGLPIGDHFQLRSFSRRSLKISSQSDSSYASWSTSTAEDSEMSESSDRAPSPDFLLARRPFEATSFSPVPPLLLR